MSQTAYVERIIEQTTSSLSELIEKSYLTKQEAAKILQKRRDFEYGILSNGVEKDYFLKYLNYEMNIVSLISTRKKLNGLPKMAKWQKIIGHVFVIFERALKKYRTDEILWKSFIDFAIEYNFRIEFVFESALSANPGNEKMWVLAAKWHQEYNFSPDSARALFERGVKTLPSSASIWVAYYKFEVQQSIPVKLEEEGEEEEKIIEEEAKDYDFTKLIDVIQRIEQVKDFEKNARMRFEMLDVICRIEKSEHLQNMILERIMKLFRHDEEIIYQCITFKLKKANEKASLDIPEEDKPNILEIEKETLNILKETANLIPTAKMWEMLSIFCLESIQKHKNDSNLNFYVDYLLNTVYYEANLKDLFTLRMYYDYASVLAYYGFINTSIQILEATIKLFPSNYKIWRLYLSILISEKRKSIEMKMDECLHNFSKDLEKLTSEEAEIRKKERENISIFILKYLIGSKSDKIQQYFKNIIRNNTESFTLKKMYFDWENQTNGREGARKASDFILSIVPNCLNIYHVMTEFEKEIDMKSKRLILIYEGMCKEHGNNNENAWLDYIEFCKKAGDARKAHHLYFLATKNLENVQNFLIKYEKIK